MDGRVRLTSMFADDEHCGSFVFRPPEDEEESSSRNGSSGANSGDTSSGSIHLTGTSGKIDVDDMKSRVEYFVTANKSIPTLLAWTTLKGFEREHQRQQQQ